MSQGGYERRLQWECQIAGLPVPEAEIPFARAQGRRWRFDLGWPDQRIAAEVEGGIWKGGRHTRGLGYERDCEKYNAAALLGWRVLRFTTQMVKDGRALKTLEQLFREVDRTSVYLVSSREI